jgi:hypothetical protein
MLAACTRFDLWLGDEFAESQTWMHSRRRQLAAVAIIASVLDLVLTQTILTLVADRTGVQPAEANPLMAGIVMTWWAWPFRVGIPCLAVVRDIRAGNYGLITTAAALYTCVIVWNTWMLYQVNTVLA